MQVSGDKLIKGTEIQLDIDLICIAVGLRPLSELCRMAGMEFDYQPHLGGFVPLHDENMQATIRGMYVAGDNAGVEEASSAMEEGKLAGLAATLELGKLDAKTGKSLIDEVRERLRSLRLGPYGDFRQQAKERIRKAFSTVRKGTS